MTLLYWRPWSPDWWNGDMSIFEKWKYGVCSVENIEFFLLFLYVKGSQFAEQVYSFFFTEIGTNS